MVLEFTLERIGYDYIDLMLLHQPMGDYIGAWRGLEKLYKEGIVKSIGMTNCYPHVLADLCETFEIKPMINQVEMPPFFQQRLNLDTMKERGAAVIPKTVHEDRMKQNFDVFDLNRKPLKRLLHIFKKTVGRSGKYLVSFPDNIKVSLHLWLQRPETQAAAS